MIGKLDVKCGHNKNSGRNYTKEQLQIVIDEYLDKPDIQRYIDTNPDILDIDIERICGIVRDVIVVNDDIVVEYDFINKTPESALVKNLYANKVKLQLVAVMTGVVSSDKTVDDLCLHKISISL